MSLINQVLRDLDARGAVSQARRFNPWSPDAPRTEEAHFHAYPTGPSARNLGLPRHARRPGQGTAWRHSLLGVLTVLLLGMIVVSPWAPQLVSPRTPALAPAGGGTDGRLARAAALPSVLSTTLRPAETAALGQATPVATPVAGTRPRHAATAATLAVDKLPPPAAGAPRLAAASTSSTTAALATVTALPREAGTVEKKMSPLSPAQRAQAAYAQAVESTQAGRPVQAQAQAMEALRLQPGHQAARHLAAALLHETGRTDAGIELLREGLALNPRTDGLALLLARLQTHKGLLQEALATLDHHQLHTIEAEALRAGLCSQLRQYKAAIQAYQSVLERQPGQVTWWLGLAIALEGDGQTALARQTFTRVQAMGLSDPDLLAYVSQRLMALE